MKGVIQSKRHSILVVLSLLFSILLISYSQAGVLGPGWEMVTADPVSLEEDDVYESQQLAPEEISGLTALSATSPSPGIIELARALQYDPKLIYDYVHNHIDYVPYFGSLKGATLTYLDGSGNDFDQASLFIALLRESANYNSSLGSVQYKYGYMTIPGADLANWLGVDQNADVIGKVIGSGGIPVVSGYPLSDGTTKFRRLWIKANINGVDYLFDPAFKQYNYKTKIDIGNSMGYNQDDLLTAVATGATIGSDYTQNLNETGLGNKLAEYSSNMINNIRSQYHRVGREACASVAP
jgi:hypothetical protein